MRRAIVWYRSDLRVTDHEPLFNASKDYDEIIPVFVIDKQQYFSDNYGSQKMGNFRLKFLLEALNNLKENLKKLGGDLVVIQGNPVDEIINLALKYSASTIFVHKEAAFEEVQEENILEIKLPPDMQIKFYWGHTLLHINDLPFRIQELPNVFTPFRKECEKHAKVRQLIPAPDSVSIPKNLSENIPSAEELGFAEPTNSEHATYHLSGGEAAALSRMNEYIWDSKGIRVYKKTRNGLLGKSFSSKFSPYLAMGCISPRTIYYEVKKFEREVESNQSTYWMIFELYWRDFFRFQSVKYPKAFFKLGGTRESTPSISENEDLLTGWKNAKTGIPFIDANMKELNETGFMSNRGRQNVASFLVHDLKQDWRKGAAYFEQQLIDYDPTSNWGNWAYVAGVGTDPRENRYFNIMSQADRYDEKGKFVRHWLPELENVSSASIHKPWKMERNELAFYNLAGTIYEKPLLVPEKWKV